MFIFLESTSEIAKTRRGRRLRYGSTHYRDWSTDWTDDWSQTVHAPHSANRHLLFSSTLFCSNSGSNQYRGLHVPLRINVELGLFESLNPYKNGVPEFLSVGELADFQLTINVEYRSRMTYDGLDRLGQLEWDS